MSGSRKYPWPLQRVFSLGWPPSPPPPPSAGISMIFLLGSLYPVEVNNIYVIYFNPLGTVLKFSHSYSWLYCRQRWRAAYFFKNNNVNFDLVTRRLLFYCTLCMGIITRWGSKQLGNERLRLCDLIFQKMAVENSRCKFMSC